MGSVLDTVNYEYGNTNWGDLLTSYDGVTISSDPIGNTTSDGTWTYTWKHGRELASMSGNGTVWSFTYGADGMRTKRASSMGKTYNYVYNGSQLTRMTVAGNTLTFTYDAAGTPVSVKLNNTVYYYETNLQGDVTAIVDGNGEVVAYYFYDAWGRILYATDSGNSLASNTIATLNPLRYRGYVYDVETGLYYLQSRYYDPEMGRFLTHDIVFDNDAGLQGYDLFVYCGNNPTNRIDSSGTDSEKIDDADLADDELKLAGSSGKGGGFGSTTSSSRRSAVKQAWAKEVEAAKNGSSKYNWTPEQYNELITTGHVSGYEGHHIVSVSADPNLAGDPNNIWFCTREQHLYLHFGNWRTPTFTLRA